MIQITFKEPVDDPKWLDWCKRCEKAVKKLKGSKNPASEIDEDLYKEERLRFLNAFHQKCAYCELKIVAGQRAGDVEHFRPKGRVTNENFKRVFSDDDAHTGYYWLAYSWRNLLPACLACNRPGTDPSGFQSGKWDRFPVADQKWARSGHGLRDEEPLLINPWFDDPNDHLVFNDPTGVIGFKTRKGEMTIRILGLNRDGLKDARRNAFRLAQKAFKNYYLALVEDDEEETNRSQEDYEAFQNGSAEFAACGRAAIEIRRRKHEENLRKRKPDFA